MPRSIYCIHALSLFCFKLGIAPQIQDLYGKVQFTEEEISAMRSELEKYGIQMPAFSKIGGILANEMSVDDAALHAAIIAINEAIDNDNAEETMAALQNPSALLAQLHGESAEKYQTLLFAAKETKAEAARNRVCRQYRESSMDEDKYVVLYMSLDKNLEHDVYDEYLTQAEIQGNVNKINTVEALVRVDDALSRKDKDLLLQLLKSHDLGIRNVKDENIDFYIIHLDEARDNKMNNNTDKDSVLGKEEIQEAVNQGNLDADVEYQRALAVTNINLAIANDEVDHLVKVLQSPSSQLPPVFDTAGSLYMEEFKNMKDEKQASCELLTHYEICTCIEEINQQVTEEHERVLAIGEINKALGKGDPTVTFQALEQPSAKLNSIDEKQSYRYHVLLVRQKQEKEKETGDEDAELWIEEIQTSIESANKDAETGLKMSKGLFDINSAIDGLEENLGDSLQNQDLGLHSIIPECMDQYKDGLQKCRENKLKKFYYNKHQDTFAWARPDDVVKDHSLLTKEEIQKVITDITSAHDRGQFLKANESFVVKIQSHTRGYLARKQYKQRLHFMQTQIPAVVKIQAAWKGAKQKRKYQERLQYLQDKGDTAIKIQSFVRMWKAMRDFKKRLQYFKDNEAAVVKIQAFVRSNKARHDYRALMMEENPPLNVVQRFVHLLDASDVDYSEEIELQKLRQKVVTEIRSTKQLETDLDQMDIKIGLLIKNRISLQDVVSQDKKLSKYKEDRSIPKGLKALNKDCHDRLEAYQHLFYLLQTNPTYLAKLIFEMPQSKTTKFMESVIYSLFNYGSNQREEYLLIRLFKKALEEEIASKVDKMSDFVTGNPLVVKMIVGFNRNQRGQNALRDMLSPLVNSVIEDKTLKINTNPIEVYKVWVNTTESTTGKTSGLPYDVTTEQALKHEEVQVLIQEMQRNYKEYGMRYMAKILKTSLIARFPEAAEKDILKIVGNLLYYRYINSAIVAPDGFGIIDVGAEIKLSNDQRRNLGSVAKILQFAASNKGFGGDSSYLASMNNYIREAHEKFKKFCMEACEVPEPDVWFNVDQYTDLVTITKPVIYISAQEVCDTHQLLLQHQDQIAPDSQDPLHELLEDLSDVPTVIELLGGEIPEDEKIQEMLIAQLGKTEISLTLTNKFEVPQDDQADVKQLLIRTKRMVVDVIACQPAENVKHMLENPSTDEQEDIHQAIVKKRDVRDKKMTESQGTGVVRQQSILGDTRMPLSIMKTKITKNLQTLELEQVVTRKNNYQDIINMIAQDIRNQRRYRNQRKQELMKIKQTLKGLQEKRKFYESQIDYYNRYVKTCIDNLQKKSNYRKSRGLFKRGDADDKEHHEKLKYSGAKLYEKGIVLEIEGLPTNQFKNVQFEITGTKDPGVFDVNAKFMGVEMDKVELIFQDLLQLQYDDIFMVVNLIENVQQSQDKCKPVDFSEKVLRQTRKVTWL
ncbi:Ras GTPase-activating-like protein IQGAP1,Ras GTPase-activating-like protein IQGAP3,Ras GTPase-activating-like protein IQGAP2 [Mytilus edulis]|uniref:Ras GTPase-activating-like protein IQGAP1,Ras GTPase-activating-like protein IQGAP3,Ras GTPase-activating-like protein IQGAP2 n=1 Tax=Mytilus edulis TaxID=6550 RepID=A0A8S3S8P5_MYTED|nr:Ras GTPase-activating-like protein IQGAP1,Ras GTPase-activating-like protein IQGAP3,Ras GTPase-activating-like protein IQGAP2 [Mytilus edulis]